MYPEPATAENDVLGHGGSTADRMAAPAPPATLALPCGLSKALLGEIDAAIAILSADADRPIVLEINPQFERQTGFARHDIQGSSLFSLFKGNGRGGVAFRKLRQALQDHESAVVTISMRGRGNVIVPTRLTLRPFMATDRSTQFLCIIRSLAAASTQNAAAMTEDAAPAVTDRLLTFLSHDLRTPLNGILGFSEIMMSGMLGHLEADDYKAYARDIHAAGQDLLQIVNGLLDLNHSETGRLKLSDSVFTFDACIDSCLGQMRDQAAKAGVVLSRKVARGLPAFRGDEARLRQVLLILLSNAIKFTPTGGRVTLAARRTTAGVEVACRDTGVGMTKGRLLSPFSPYHRSYCRDEDAYTNPRAGIGVGLPLAKLLVERHGGSLRIASKEAEGTTVTLSFPEDRLIKADPKNQSVKWSEKRENSDHTISAP